MRPEKGKTYLIHHTPSKDADYYYSGYGECLSGLSNEGLYVFRLITTGEVTMFVENEILCEHDIHEN